MKAIIWKDETLGAEFDIGEIPADYEAKAAEYRAKLVEMAVEQDDAALEAYLDGKEPDEETLQRCIRKGTIASAFVPVLCGSRLQEQGRAAAARCRGRLSCRRRPTSPPINGTKMGTDEPIDAASARTTSPSPVSPSRS